MFGHPFRPPGAPRLRPNVRVSPQEPSVSPPTLMLPLPVRPLPALAPGAGRENRPVHPLFCRPSSPVPPSTPRLRPNPAPALPPPPPPNCYAATDPGIHWLNNRPYWVHRLLGRGGFGEVHEVEMLLPRGLGVDWDEKGDLSFDEGGYVALRQSSVDPAGEGSRLLAHGGGHEDRKNIQLPPSEVPQAEVPSLPMSMTTSESMWFSEVRREQALNGGSLSGGGLGLSSEGQGALGVDEDAVKNKTGVHAHFPADSGNFVQRSGVFFALKLQKARNGEQLDCLVKEVENMRLFSGEAGIVQLRDHAVDRKSLSLVILMELGACDLHEFLKQNQYCLSVPSIARVWSILVHRVETLHKFDVVHRDIKPQNFILVPTEGHRGVEILVKTSTPRKDFVFRLVQCDAEGPTARNQRGDVELVIKNPTTNKEEVVPLSIKLTDFGIARSLDEDASHLSLSVPGPNGTVVFMAPETVRQTVNRCRKVSKRVDIWALGVMLYQMLHAGKTPVGEYLVKGGPPEALLAIASETVNREAMKFDASNIWTTERTRLLSDQHSSETHDDPSSQDELPTMTAEMVKTLVVSWVGAELLVRVCKRCLVFDVDDRIDGTDLRVWVDEAIESGWGLRNFDVSQSELLQVAFNIDANGMMQTVDIEIARIGERVGSSLFPGIWMPPVPSPQDPRRTVRPLSSGPSRTKGRVMPGSSSGTSNSINSKDFVDLEAPQNDHNRDDTDGSVSESGAGFLERRRQGRFRWLVVWILVCVVGLALSSGLAAVLLSRKNNGDQPSGISPSSGPLVVVPTSLIHPGGPSAAAPTPGPTRGPTPPPPSPPPKEVEVQPTPSGGAPLPQVSTPAFLSPTLESSSASSSVIEISGVPDARPRAPDLFQVIWRHLDHLVFESSATLLNRLGEVVEALAQTAEKGDATVIVGLLIRLGDDVSALRADILKALAQIAEKGDATVIATVIAALLDLEVQGAGAHPPLVQGDKHERKYWGVREQVATALTQIAFTGKGSETVIKALLICLGKRLHSPEHWTPEFSDFRSKVVVALMQIAGKDKRCYSVSPSYLRSQWAIWAIWYCLGDSNGNVRTEVVRALAQIAQKGYTDFEVQVAIEMFLGRLELEGFVLEGAESVRADVEVLAQMVDEGKWRFRTTRLGPRLWDPVVSQTLGDETKRIF